MIKKEFARKVFWYGLVPFFLLMVIYRPRVDGYLNPNDEGHWLAVAQALFEGKALYKDVFFHYGPLWGLLFRSTLTWMPATLSSLREVIWVLNGMGLLCVYFCLLRWVKSSVLRLCFGIFLSIVPLTASILTIPMAARYGIGFLPFLLWPRENDAQRGDLPASFLAGFGAVMACLLSQEIGFSAAMAGACYFSFDRVPKRRHYFFAGVAVSSTIALLWLLATNSLVPYLNCTLMETAQIVIYGQIPWPSLIPRFGNTLVPWFVPLMKWGEALALYLPAATYAAVIFSVWRARARRRPFSRTLLAFSVFGACMAWLAWMHADGWHIYLAASSALFLWAVLADQAPARYKEKAVLSAIVLGALVTLPHYAARQLKDKIFKSQSRLTRIPRAGTVRLPVQQAAGYEFLVDWIQSHTKPGEPILFYPYDGSIYFLADRPNPCFYPVLSLATHPAMQERAVRDILAASPKWVIWDTENTSFLGVPIKEFLALIHQMILSHYTVSEKVGPFLFLKRNSRPHAVQ